MLTLVTKRFHLAATPMDSKESKCKYADEEEEVSKVTSKKRPASGDDDSDDSSYSSVVR
jgi:hypothetical protein